jgi:hypothetical protein
VQGGRGGEQDRERENGEAAQGFRTHMRY